MEDVDPASLLHFGVTETAFNLLMMNNNDDRPIRRIISGTGQRSMAITDLQTPILAGKASYPPYPTFPHIHPIFTPSLHIAKSPILIVENSRK